MHHANENAPCCFGETDLASLKHWLEQQHPTDADNYFSALSNACRDIEKLDTLRASVAVSLLDELRPAIHRHTTRLANLFLHQSIDLPLAARRAADQTATLWQLLGDAYFSVTQRDRGILGESIDGILIKPSKEALTCLHRSLLCQQQILLQNILLYRADSPGQWHAFHHRFALALRRGIHETRVNDSSNHERPISCMTDVYTSLCVLRVSNCNQLNQLEIMQLWQWLQKFAVLIELKKSVHDSIYKVNLDSDLPPLRVFNASDKEQLFAIEDLALLDELATTNDDVSLTPRLKEHVQRALNGDITRSMPRHKSHGHVDIAIGLVDTWHTFSHRRSLDDMTRHLNRQTALYEDENNPFMKAKRETFLIDAWNIEGHAHTNAHAEVASMHIVDEIRRASLDSKGVADITQSLTRAETLEHSARGFCLSIPLPLSKAIKNGDLLAIREHEDDMFVVGCIRWIRSDQEAIVFGVEVLSPNAICFGVRHIPSKGDIHREIFSFALLLPAIPKTGQAAGLLLPRAPYHPGSKVQLLRDELELLIRLEDDLQSTFSHSLYSFVDIEDPMARIPEIGQRVKSYDSQIKALLV